MTLRNQLFWRTFALIMLVVVLVSATLFHVLHLRHHAVAQREAEANAVFLASQCVKPQLWDDRLLLKSLLAASVDKKVAEYAWLEVNGAPLVHTFALGVPKGLLSLHPRGRSGSSVQSWQDRSGRVYLDIATPLPAPAVGILHVGITEGAVDEGVAEMLPATAAIALLVSALGAVLAWLMANAVSRETRAANQALAESELKYRTLADNTADWEFWVGPDEKAIYNSPACERVIGYSPAQLAADPGLFATVIHADDAGRFAAHRHTVSHASVEGELEIRIVRTDGEIRWLLHRCRPVFGANGAFLGSRGVNTDITERKLAEQKLAESQLQLQTIIETEPECVKLLAADGTLLQMNRAGLDMIEADTPEQVVGQRVLGIVEPAYRAAFVALTRRVFEGGSGNLEFEIRGLKGTHRWLESHAVPLPDAQGNVAALLSVTRDITKRKSAEESLRQLNESLEQRVKQEVALNREKDHLMIQQSRLAAMGEMIGNIAHQWRQPINALGLVLANIKDAYEYGELDKEYLDKSVKSGQRLIQAMSGTIDDFRNFFKPNKEKQNFRVCDSVEEAVKLVNHGFKSNNIELAFEQSCEPCNALGYPNEFSQVVLNALSNAKDAIVEKKGRGKVSIRFEFDADTAVVSIRDNGGGIPAEVLGKVFDPYFTTKEKGTGIGLYMSKMIMDNMGGDIAIRNVADGAEVTIALPLAGEAAADGAVSGECVSSCL